MTHKVFVSFDYDHDRHYKYLLEAWHANPRFQFVFDDKTPEEINSSNIGRIKAALTAKINGATHTLVIVGQHANAPHAKRELIGKRNWINWEVAQSIAARNRIAAVRLEPTFASPEEITGALVAWASSFQEAAIISALERA